MVWFKLPDLDMAAQQPCHAEARKQRISSRPDEKADHKDTDEGINKGKLKMQADLQSERNSNNAQLGVVQLSSHRTQPMNVLDLPMDVLYNIFDHFQDDHTWRVDWAFGRPSADQRQTIQSARLVCRLFHQFASPLLCPILQVRLDQESLDLVNEISRSPLMATGVRGIQVRLDYRPRELATDLSRFKDQREKELQKIYGWCDYQAEGWYLRGYDSDDDTICAQPLREYRKAMHYYECLRFAWNDCLSPADGNAKDADSLAHQQVLRQCHEEYRRKHEEQLQLITDGSFVASLASSISKMASCTSLHFANDMDGQNYIHNPTFLLNSTELSRFMTAPQSWRTIEELEGGADLAPAKILSELPIAIHKSGTALRALRITCFPLTSNYSMICPDREDRLRPAWADLQAACQQLEDFEFAVPLSHGPVRHNHHLAEDQVFIDNYLAAVLSGQILEVVKLDLHAFTNTTRGNGDGLEGSYDIGSVFTKMNWPCIKQVTIYGVSLKQGELERFCHGLGYKFELIILCDMELLSGSWAGALEILRENISSRCLGMKCTVNFSLLAGGEFAILPKTVASPPWFSESSDPSWDSDLGTKLSGVEKVSLVTLAQKYVTVVGVAENPLKRSTAGQEYLGVNRS